MTLVMSFMPRTMLSACRSVLIVSGQNPCAVAGSAWLYQKLPLPWPTSKMMPRFCASNR